MRDFKIQTYQRKLEYSYCIGVFPVIELLMNKPKEVSRVILSSRGKMNSGVARIMSLCKTNNIKVGIADDLIVKLGGTENSYAVALFAKYEMKIEAGNQLILVNPEDTGNMGTIIRSALGFGIKNIAIMKPGVDCFDPKTIRASMGAVFHMNIEYFDYFEDYKKKFPNKCYLFMTDGEKELSQVSFQKPFSLVFGSESAGLDNTYGNQGQTVSIKQSRDIDSLNLSIAVGIVLYKSFS
jgi:TrmH family RNA methyltransferase